MRLGAPLWPRSATVLEHGAAEVVSIAGRKARRARLGQVPSDRLGVLHHQLHLRRAIVFIRIKPERHPRAFAQGVRMAEPDGVEAHAVLFQQQFQMALFQDALADDAEFVAEDGRGEALAPYLAIHQLDEGRRVVGVFQRAVRFHHPFQLLGVSVPFGATKLVASYIRHNDKSNLNRDAQQWALGAYYALSKRSDLYTGYGHISNKNGATFVVGNATDNGTGNSGFNLGMRHLF